MKELRLPSKQRGIFGSLFGSKSRSRSETDATRDATQIQSGTVQTTGTQQTQLLEDPIRQAANSLVMSLVREQGAEGEDLARIARALEERAMEAEATQGRANTAALTAARREGERGIQRLTTQLAADAGGSTRNSFVAGATAEALVDLETNLAAIEGDLNIKARNLGTQELAAAVEAFKAAQVAGSSDTNALAQLIGVLRGASSVTTSDELQTVDMTEQLSEIVNELVKGRNRTQGPIFAPISLGFGRSSGG